MFLFLMLPINHVCFTAIYLAASPFNYLRSLHFCTENCAPVGFVNLFMWNTSFDF